MVRHGCKFKRQVYKLKHEGRFVVQAMTPRDEGIGRVYRWDEARKIRVLVGALSHFDCHSIDSDSALFFEGEEWVRVKGDMNAYSAWRAVFAANTRRWAA